MIALLDSGPLGILTNPRATPETVACNAWVARVVSEGSRVLVPEIADYEVRRELLRAGKMQGIARLDDVATQLGYLPITTADMRRAADYWALARRRGRPAAGDGDLDADMILAAHAALLAATGQAVVIATTNVRHLALFADARRWQDIG